MKSRRAFPGYVFSALLAAATALHASAAGAVFCSIGTVTDVTFNTYNVFSATPNDALGAVKYTCSLYLGIDVIIIDLSTGQSGTYTSRTMKSASGATLSYNLYLDATRLFVWGDGIHDGSFHYGPLGLILGQVSVPIYGRIPPLQNAQAGSYSDLVVITTLF